MARKLILRNKQAPGDILMLTAAVRDLHLSNPSAFLTDVRTFGVELWKGNPYITRIEDQDEDAEVIDCQYPLINASNDNGRHFASAFQDFLADRLGVNIQVHKCAGDIYLTERELAEHPLRRQARDREKDLWVVVAGGKFDFTCKWWPTEYFQSVVHALSDSVVFVQVGDRNHFHPKLEGVVNLIGSTSLRDLIHLLFWSSGVLCPVTFLMHLAAAVPVNPSVRNGLRPCIALAGGREPPSWEAYPGHQFLHTVGMLDCCAFGGCWRSRVFPLFDGLDDEKWFCDRPDSGFATCMRMITPERVIGSIRGFANDTFNSPRQPLAEKLRRNFFSAIDHRMLLVDPFLGGGQ